MEDVSFLNNIFPMSNLCCAIAFYRIVSAVSQCDVFTSDGAMIRKKGLLVRIHVVGGVCDCYGMDWRFYQQYSC